MRNWREETPFSISFTLTLFNDHFMFDRLIYSNPLLCDLRNKNWWLCFIFYWEKSKEGKKQKHKNTCTCSHHNNQPLASVVMHPIFPFVTMDDKLPPLNLRTICWSGYWIPPPFHHKDITPAILSSLFCNTNLFFSTESY